MSHDHNKRQDWDFRSGVTPERPITNQKKTVISRMNSCEPRIPMEGSVRDFIKERCCYCSGALNSSQISSSAETVCIACQRLHSLPVESEKGYKCLDPRSRHRNPCGIRTDIEDEKGHRCRSGVNESCCLRCVSSVVRWNSAKRTVQRLIWLIVPLLLLTFVTPNIAQFQESTSSNATYRKGEWKWTHTFMFVNCFGLFLLDN